VKLHTVLLTAAASIALAACNPAPSEPAPETPPPAPIAEPTAPSGPAAENTSDSLSTAPPTDVAAATPGAAPAPPASPATPPAAPAAAGPTKEELANGAAVYARTCAMCHGPTGAGTAMGVALTAGHEYAAIKEKITKGPMNTGDKMPPLGAALSADDLDDVAKFVESGL
jgi:mono/diheme cytochrome c family protein